MRIMSRVPAGARSSGRRSEVEAGMRYRLVNGSGGARKARILAERPAGGGRAGVGARMAVRAFRCATGRCCRARPNTIRRRGAHESRWQPVDPRPRTWHRGVAAVAYPRGHGVARPARRHRVAQAHVAAHPPHPRAWWPGAALDVRRPVAARGGMGATAHRDRRRRTTGRDRRAEAGGAAAQRAVAVGSARVSGFRDGARGELAPVVRAGDEFAVPRRLPCRAVPVRAGAGLAGVLLRARAQQ